jgi:hypothetical protein
MRVAVAAVISSQAAAPVTTDASRCGAGTVTLTASSPDPVTWYDAASGGNVVGTGTNFQTPIINSTITYYAIAGITGCLSPAVAATATVDPMPADPAVTGDERCGPGSLTLTANASDPMTWYSQPTGGNVVATGTSYNSTFTSTTTVYVEANDGTCSSNRIPVTATINANPIVNLGPPVITINQGQSIVLNAGSGFSDYDWSTGATASSISVNSDGTYFVDVTDANGCHGYDTVVVNVLQISVSENEISDAIQLYPNPSTGMINIRVNTTSRFRLDITDVIGQALITDSYKANSFFDRNYDLSSFAKGIYYLRITSESGNATRTIIIQ